MTKKQMETWIFVCEYSEKHGYGPTLTEMCKDFGILSPASAKKRVDPLVKAGLLARENGMRQRIEVIFKPVGICGLSLEEALREAGEDGRVTFEDHTYGMNNWFTPAQILTRGWEVVKKEAMA